MIYSLTILQFCQLYLNKTEKKRGNKDETPIQDYPAQKTTLLTITI